MFVTMVLAALAIDGLFVGLDLIPTDRPSTDEVFSEIELNYKALLNGLALVAFVALIALTVRRGASDSVCGMTVDRSKAVSLEYSGRTFHFCSEGCRSAFEADPERYLGGQEPLEGAPGPA